MNLLAATSALAPHPSPLLILLCRTLSRGSFACHHVINVSLSQDVLFTNFAVRGAGRGSLRRGEEEEGRGVHWEETVLEVPSQTTSLRRAWDGGREGEGILGKEGGSPVTTREDHMIKRRA